MRRFSSSSERRISFSAYLKRTTYTVFAPPEAPAGPPGADPPVLAEPQQAASCAMALPVRSALRTVSSSAIRVLERFAWQLCSSMPRPEFTGRRVDSSGAGGAGGDEAQLASAPATMMQSIFAFMDSPSLSSKQAIDPRILTALLLPV